MTSKYLSQIEKVGQSTLGQRVQATVPTPPTSTLGSATAAIDLAKSAMTESAKRYAATSHRVVVKRYAVK